MYPLCSTLLVHRVALYVSTRSPTTLHNSLCLTRAAFEVDPLLPVVPALDGIGTAVRRLARLVHRRVGQSFLPRSFVAMIR